jgi:hypothetical protein
MHKDGRLPTGGVIQQASDSLSAPDLTNQAERLIDAYLETFEQAPESDFLLKRYFFTVDFEKKYLQDNVFFIPRADFLWFFKYYKGDKPTDQTIELKKRSAEKAEKEVEIATIQIRTFYTYEQGAADILYTRRFADQEGVEFILKNTNEAVRYVEQLLADFRNDRVTRRPY